MFGGTLGDWETEPIDLELKPGYKPFNCKYYLVPGGKKYAFGKYPERLMKIGVLTPVQHSQCGTPVFIIPTKEGTVGFITDYCRLNQKLVRKPYQLPRIGDTIQQLEGFQYATALDLNMRYFTIRISPASQDKTSIVNEFGVFMYNFLVMGMCASVDIFQAKLDKIIGDIEGVKTYINYISVLIKKISSKYIEKLRVIFGRFLSA